MEKCGKCIITASLAILAGISSGCSSTATTSRVSTETVPAESCPGCAPTPPGVTEFVWEEPMVDVIDVPPGLDPEGIYYRPAHQAIVEIRQGRYRYYKAP